MSAHLCFFSVIVGFGCHISCSYFLPLLNFRAARLQVERSAAAMCVSRCCGAPRYDLGWQGRFCAGEGGGKLCAWWWGGGVASQASKFELLRNFTPWLIVWQRTCGAVLSCGLFPHHFLVSGQVHHTRTIPRCDRRKSHWEALRVSCVQEAHSRCKLTPHLQITSSENEQMQIVQTVFQNICLALSLHLNYNVTDQCFPDKTRSWHCCEHCRFQSNGILFLRQRTLCMTSSNGK